MSALPKGWTRTKLQEVGRWGSGGTPKSTELEYYGGPIPWVRSGDLPDGPVTNHEVEITESGLANSSAKWVPEQSVLIAMYGATVGRLGISTYPITTNQAVAFCAVDRVLAEPQFLFWFLLGIRNELIQSAQGGAQPNISQEIIKRQDFPLPPLAEQRRIVAKLDALDASSKRARADLDRIPALVARAKQAILEKAFRGELTADWRKAHYEIVSTNFEKITKSRVTGSSLRRLEIAKIPDFPIPGSWEWVSPDQVAADEKYSIGIGPFGSNLVKTDYRSQGVRLVFVRDIRRGSFSTEDARYIDPTKASGLHQHLARPGDVLITKMGDPPGDSCVFPNYAEPAIVTADCIKLTPHSDLAESNYLNYCIRSKQVQGQFKSITAGVAQQKVSLERFRQLALPIAPLPEQTEIVRRIESTFAKIDRLAAEAASASKLMDRLDQALLAKAFRGELVPQDPADEPAEELLARLQAARAAAPKPARTRRKKEAP